MIKKLFISALIIGSVMVADAEVLFYTDFSTTPEGFAAASKRATDKGSDDTLVINDSGATGPKIAVIDGCTLSVAKSSTGRPLITISKSTQTCVKYGDTAGCTKGRLSLKNSNNSITLPSVPGPCTITYYAASSSATAGRALQCVINGVSTPEAGISELLLEDSQATRKVVYPCSIEGPVVFKLIAQGGGVYLYDIKIESGAVVSLNHPNLKRIPSRNKSFIMAESTTRFEIFTLKGENSIPACIRPLASRSKTIYIIRIPGSNKKGGALVNLSR